MTEEEEYFQKAFIRDNSLALMEHVNETKRFLNMYNNLIHNAISWHSWDEKFYTLIIKQIKDSLDGIVQISEYFESNYIELNKFLEKEREIAQGKNISNKQLNS